MIGIDRVTSGSLADEAGIEAGDLLVTINAHPINDLVDYFRALESDCLSFEILRRDERILVACEKLPDEDFGLEVEHPEPQQCGNQCVFCFVHQLPKGMRRSLYIKDEDYRFSYLYGSFITLTNLEQKDLYRITTEKLSPLYISVHATDSQVRDQLLGCKVPDIVPLLELLAQADILLHCQIVLCPGINDGTVLEETITKLATLHPQVASIAVVPVGLTRYREHLPVLRPLTSADAVQCVEHLKILQRQFLQQHGTRLVYAADEMYLLAGLPVPQIDEYEDLPQVENGVGLLAGFRDEAKEVLIEADPIDVAAAVVITGHSFLPELTSFSQRLALRTGVDIEVVGIENTFFGSGVTVAGLVTGADMVRQLGDILNGRPLLVPDVMLRSDKESFLDDMSVADLSRALGVRIEVVDSSPWGLLEGLERLAEGPIDIIRC